MVPIAPKSQQPPSGKVSVFNYSYVVLAILMLLTIGSTIAYFDNSVALHGEMGVRWTPVVFLIGLCVSLLIFGMTHREIAAKLVLEQKTRDLIAAQRRNEELLAAEQSSRIVAEKANLAKDEFLAVVSHELKTPLNAIAGWNRILKTYGISEETRRTAVEKIDKNLRLQTAIVEELLRFSDVMSSTFTLDPKSFRMRSVFEEAVTSIAAAASKKGVSIIEEDLLDGECIRGDRDRMKIALASVLMNAVKFTQKGGRITTRTFAIGEVVKCVITDNGIGIDPDQLPFIFEEYSQSEKSSTRRYGGLGLGLTIAARIVKLHKGTIEAQSSGIGLGSSFTITLPVTGESGA